MKTYLCELCQVKMELEHEFEPTAKRRYYMRRYNCPLCGNTELKINSQRTDNNIQSIEKAFIEMEEESFE